MQKIQDIGGKTVQKAVKFSMEVMTDDLTQKVIWTLGAENIPKISKFTFIIIDTYARTHAALNIHARAYIYIHILINIVSIF